MRFDMLLPHVRAEELDEPLALEAPGIRPERPHRPSPADERLPARGVPMEVRAATARGALAVESERAAVGDEPQERRLGRGVAAPDARADRNASLHRWPSSGAG